MTTDLRGMKRWGGNILSGTFVLGGCRPLGDRVQVHKHEFVGLYVFLQVLTQIMLRNISLCLSLRDGGFVGHSEGKN